jgi:photosystem II stability/assembly factor-like uncharacterized protein
MSFMKILPGVVLSLGALLTNPAQAQFRDPLDTPAMMSPLVTQYRLTAITQAGDALIAVGPFGHILRSQDRGASWQQMEVPLSSDLVAVQFPSAKLGWAVGHDGVILHTQDGGTSWTKQLDGIQAGTAIKTWYDTHAQGEDEAAVALRGEAERFASEGADKPFLDVCFIDENEGFAVGAFNLAMHTRDGGKTWEPLIDRTDNPSAFHLYAMTGSADALYLVGEQGLIRRWNREASRFERIESPYHGSYFGALSTADALFVFGMRGNAFRSRDGGANWQKLETGVSAAITGATATADGRIVFATQGGGLLVSRDGGDHFTSVPTSHPMPLFGVTFAGGNTVATVGRNGVEIETLQ